MEMVIEPPHVAHMAQAAALKAAAAHVGEVANVSGWDSHAHPTQTEECHREQTIMALGRDLSKLADEALTRTIAFSEFEPIRVALMDLGFALKPEHVEHVLNAV